LKYNSLKIGTNAGWAGHIRILSRHPADFSEGGQIYLQTGAIQVHEYLIVPGLQNVKVNDFIRESSVAYLGLSALPKDWEFSGACPFAPTGETFCKNTQGAA
jgi:hypothetical protein